MSPSSEVRRLDPLEVTGLDPAARARRIEEVGPTSCIRCGQKLSLLQALNLRNAIALGGRWCPDCKRDYRQAKKEQEDQERARLAEQKKAARRAKKEQEDQERARLAERKKAASAFLAQASRGEITLERLLDASNDLLATARRLGRRERSAAVTGAIESALRDGVLSRSEERIIQAFCETLNVTPPRKTAELLLIARFNSGRLPIARQSRVFTRPGEVVHLELPAETLKEVTRREYRGGSSGVSIPIGLGVRVRAGGFSGRPVERKEIATDDVGTLAITSHRAVFLGSKRTVEWRYDKLVSVTAYSDGIQFHVSNRQSAPVLRFGRAAEIEGLRTRSGEVVAALVNASLQPSAE